MGLACLYDRHNQSDELNGIPRTLDRTSPCFSLHIHFTLPTGWRIFVSYATDRRIKLPHNIPIHVFTCLSCFIILMPIFQWYQFSAILIQMHGISVAWGGFSHTTWWWRVRHFTSTQQRSIFVDLIFYSIKTCHLSGTTRLPLPYTQTSSKYGTRTAKANTESTQYFIHERRHEYKPERMADVWSW